MLRDIRRYGALCGVLAPILFLIFYLISWNMSTEYVFGESYFSDLGVQEGAGPFNSGVVVAGLLAIPFSLSLWMTLRNGWLPLIGCGAGIATGLLLVGVGVFTEHYGGVHSVISVLFFAFAALFQIILALPLIQNPQTKNVGWIVTIMIIITVFTVGLIPSVAIPVLETIAVFEILIWTLIVAVQTLFISTRQVKQPISVDAS